ncbi:MAG: M28 family metallopeptidase [Candidatus Thermoplasmatota archaeon]
MKAKFIALFFIFLLLFSAIGYFFISGKKPHEVNFLDFDTSRAYNDLNGIVSIGSRLSGTEGEHKVAEYVASKFRSIGLDDVKISSYNATLYEVNKAELSLIGYFPNKKIPNPLAQIQEFIHKKDFVVQGYSGSREWRRFIDDLDIVDVGNGSESYENVKDKAVIVSNDGNLTPTQLFIKAYENGAKANIIQHMSAHDDSLAISTSSYSTDEKGHSIPLPDAMAIDIPSIVVSKKVGKKIKEGIKENSKLRININVTIEKREIKVVSGEIKGKEGLVMIGAHHDCVYVSVGAVDNAVGTASLIEIARQTPKKGLKNTIRFLSFGGEEQGLLGSYEYYKENKDNLKNLLCYLNLDMPHVNIKRTRKLTIASSDSSCLRNLKEITEHAKDKYPVFGSYDISFLRDNLTGGGDQGTFAIERYKVIASWGHGNWEYHTMNDGLQNVYTESLKVFGIIYGSFILEISKSKNEFKVWACGLVGYMEEYLLVPLRGNSLRCEIPALEKGVTFSIRWHSSCSQIAKQFARCMESITFHQLQNFSLIPLKKFSRGT